MSYLDIGIPPTPNKKYTKNNNKTAVACCNLKYFMKAVLFVNSGKCMVLISNESIYNLWKIKGKPLLRNNYYQKSCCMLKTNYTVL